MFVINTTLSLSRTSNNAQKNLTLTRNFTKCIYNRVHYLWGPFFESCTINRSNKRPDVASIKKPINFREVKTQKNI